MSEPLPALAYARRESRHGPMLALLILALPIIGMTVTRMLMGFVDFVMVSQLGTVAQAAVSPASLFVFAVGCFGSGIATSVQTFVSQADGRGEPHVAGSYAWQSLYLSLAAGILIAPFALTADWWFTAVATFARHPQETIQLELDYVRIALWGVAPTIFVVGLEGLFNGIQKPRVPFIAALVALAVNGFGNWLLIFGHWGLPTMGMGGAALATVIGWCVRVAILIYAALDARLHERYHTRGTLRPHPQRLRQILKIGMPTGLQWLVDLGSWIAFLGFIMPAFGTTAMAATNIGLQLMHLSFMPAVGVGIALCSQVGFAVGEHRPDRAMERSITGLKLNMLYMGVVGVLFFALRHPLVRLFNADPVVITAGGFVLIWAAIFQVFDAMGITFMNALRGAGDTRWPAILMAVVCWGVFVTGGLLMAAYVPALGLNGPWLMCTVYIILVGIALWWRWNRGAWRKIRLFDKSAPTETAAPDTAAAPH